MPAPGREAENWLSAWGGEEFGDEEGEAHGADGGEEREEGEGCVQKVKKVVMNKGVLRPFCWPGPGMCVCGRIVVWGATWGSQLLSGSVCNSTIPALGLRPEES